MCKSISWLNFPLSLVNDTYLLSDSPRSLLNCMWFVTTLFLGLRGRDEHVQMCWGDLELKTTASGEEFLEFTERSTKTRTGKDTRNKRAYNPKMFRSPVDGK